MSTILINGISFSGPDSAIQRVRGIKKDVNRTDLLTDALVAQSEGRPLNKFQKARLAEYDYEQGALVAELLDHEDRDIDVDQRHKQLCSYAGVLYLLPNQRRALERIISKEIEKHWKGGE